MAQNIRLTAIILASGKGTRLWPLTGTDTRKADAEVNEGETLLCETAKRLARIENIESVIAVCESGHEAKTRQALKHAGWRQASIVSEKSPTGTATTLAYGALEALRETSPRHAPIVVAIPVDHWFEDDTTLGSALAEAGEEARAGAACAIGVRPERAEHAYGYLQRGAPTARTASGAKLDLFIEHPTPTQALELTLGRHWRWNSGIFAIGARAYLDVLQARVPHVLDATMRAYVNGVRDNRALHCATPQLKSKGEIPFDALIAASTMETVAVELEGRWRDVGTWRGVAETRESDAEGNNTEGPVLANATRNSYIRASTRQIIAIGVDDLIIVDGPNGVLVAKKGRESTLKGALREIDKDGEGVAA